jgi:hypothetical protein
MILYTLTLFEILSLAIGLQVVKVAEGCLSRSWQTSARIALWTTSLVTLLTIGYMLEGNM